MKQLRQITLPFLAIFIVGCAALDIGADPVVVNAERSTALAADAFDGFLKIEYTNAAYLKSVAPEIHAYAEVVRRNGQKWLVSARSLTTAYKSNRSAENKANLDTAIAVLQAALAEVNKYTAEINAKVP